MTTLAIIEKSVQQLKISAGVNERERTEVASWQGSLATCENYVIDQDNCLTRRNGASVLASTDESAASMSPAYRLLVGRGNSPILYGSLGQLYDWSEKKQAFINKGKASEFGVKITDIASSATNVGVTGIVAPNNEDTTGRVLASGFTTKYSFCIIETLGSALGYSLVFSDRLTGQTVRKYVLPADAVTGATTKSYAAAAVAVDDRYVHLVIADRIGVNLAKSYVLDTNSLPSDFTGVVYTNIGTFITVTDISMVATTGYSLTVINNGTDTEVHRIDNLNVATTLSILTFLGTGCDTNGADTLVISGVNITPAHEIQKVTISTMVVASVVTSTLTIHGSKPRVACDSSGNMRVTSCTAEATAAAAINVPACYVYTVTSLAVDFTLLGILSCWTEAAHPFCDRTLSERFYTCMVKARSSMVSGAIVRELIGPLCIIDISEAVPTKPAVSTTYIRFRPAAVPDIHTTLAICSDTETGVRTRMLPRVHQLSNVVGFAYYKRIGDISRGYVFAELTIIDPSKLSIAADCISGGLLGYYDGFGIQECGFVDSPSIIVADSGVAGGPGAGTYNYIAVYDYYDSSGKVQYSRMSPVATIIMAGGNKVTVQVTAPTVAAKRNAYEISARIYRTTNGGTQYYFITNSGQRSTLSAFIDVTQDLMTDVNLVRQPVLYRQPGTANTQLDRYHCPACQHVIRHKDRVFAASGSSVYFSSFAVDGEAPWFNPAFVISVPDIGNITALASLDGSLIVFKENSIYVVNGDGPPENGGTGTEFSPPERISVDYGCVDQRSVVVTPLGVMFRSKRGIELLTKKLQVTWIGEKVMNTVDANPYTLGSCHNRTDSRVFFVLASSVTAYGQADTNTGVTVCYDLTADAWTVMKHTVENTYGRSLQDIAYAYVYGQFCNVLLSRNYPHYEPGSTTKLDVTYFVPSVIETHWIRSTPQDRIRLSDFLYLAKKLTNHAVKFSVGYDYSTSYTYTKTFQPDVIPASVEELELQIPKPLGLSFRIKLEIIEPTDTVTYPITTGLGSDILDLSVKIAQKGGGAKLPAAQKG